MFHIDIVTYIYVAPKEGRLGGYDEEGGLAPWMIQPDDNEQVSDASNTGSYNMSVQNIVQPSPIVQYQNGYGYSNLEFSNQNFPKQVC